MKKELKLSTNLIGLDGKFCTYWGEGKSEFTLYEDSIKEDFEDGYTDVHPDYYWSHFDNIKYMEDWNKRVLSFVEDVLVEVFKDVLGIEISFTYGDYYSPREYNFSHDVSNFDIESEHFNRIIAYCYNNQHFETFLKDNYTSYDGFNSFTSNNLDDWFEDISNDEATAWGAAISFMLQEYNEEHRTFDYGFEIFGGMFYSEYVNYTVLEEFIEDIKDGSVIVDDRSDWQVAVYNKYIGEDGSIKSLALECYGQLLSVEDTIKVIQKELGYDLTGRNVVEKMFSDINEKTLKLEL